MNTFLVLDTSSENCSVALFSKNQVVSQSLPSPRQHSQLLLPMVDQLMDRHSVGRNQLESVAFTRGPGSFTGIRICTSVAQGMAFALGIPVIPVSTLHTLAVGAVAGNKAQFRDGDKIFVTVDARMNEVYCGLYQLDGDGQCRPLKLDGHAEILCAPERARRLLDELGNNVSVVGSGSTYEALSVAGAIPDLQPEARFAAELVKYFPDLYSPVAPEHAEPSYLRDSVAWKKRQRIRV